MVGQNEKIVNELHSRKLKKAREAPLARPDSYLSRMLHAMGRLPSPVAEMSDEAIVRHIEDLELRPATRFETMRVVNEVLKYIGRAGLPNPRPDKGEEVTYLPKELFLAQITRLEPRYATYLGALYATGCRYAELPCAKLEGDWVFVGGQLHYEKEEVTRTKNRKKRHAGVLPPLKHFVLEWDKLSWDIKSDLCLNHYNRIYGACKKIYKANIHTLRHSYAIEARKAGKSTRKVAEWIGDTEEVCKKRYIGYLAPAKGPWG